MTPKDRLGAAVLERRQTRSARGETRRTQVQHPNRSVVRGQGKGVSDGQLQPRCTSGARAQREAAERHPEPGLGVGLQHRQRSQARHFICGEL